MLTFDEPTHVYRWDGKIVPSVTQVLHDWSAIARLDPAILAAARRLGTDVHQATALHDLDELDPESIDETVRPYLDAWIAFRRLEGFECLQIERQVYSARHRYAGTYDRHGAFRKRRNRRLALLDIKSGMPDPTHGPQTSAYVDAASGATALWDRCTVYLRPGRTPPYLVEWHKSAADFAIFLAALTYYRWKEKHGL